MMEKTEAPAKMVLSKRKTSCLRISTTPRFCPVGNYCVTINTFNSIPSNCGSNLGQGTCLCFMYCSTPYICQHARIEWRDSRSAIRDASGLPSGLFVPTSAHVQDPKRSKRRV